VALSIDQAQLIVQLSRWGTEMGLDDALSVLFSEGFVPDEATGDDPDVRKALSFFETVGTLAKHGALSPELVSDLWWVSGVWSRVESHVAMARKGSGEPRLYENFELLVANTDG
jgi:hypothetical protein